MDEKDPNYQPSSSSRPQTAFNIKGAVIGFKYKIGKKIGSGSFGDIYLGTYTLFQGGTETSAQERSCASIASLRL